jgi:hypothetical protein
MAPTEGKALRGADFIAALAACATAVNDVLIHDLVVEDCADVGLYGIKFYVMGKWITVAVDDRFPCTQEHGQWAPLFAAPKKHSEQEAGQKEIWPMLFEKAFAKLFGSYECTDAGFSEDALQLLSGGVIDILRLEGRADEFDRLRAALREDSQHDTFVCCTCRRDMTSAVLRAKGLFSGHAYSVTRALVSSRGVRLVQVHNPWGRCEWNGAYSDKSAEMTAELQAELNSDVEEVLPNLNRANRFAHAFLAIRVATFALHFRQSLCQDPIHHRLLSRGARTAAKRPCVDIGVSHSPEKARPGPGIWQTTPHTAHSQALAQAGYYSASHTLTPVSTQYSHKLSPLRTALAGRRLLHGVWRFLPVLRGLQVRGPDVLQQTLGGPPRPRGRRRRVLARRADGRRPAGHGNI